MITSIFTLPDNGLFEENSTALSEKVVLTNRNDRFVGTNDRDIVNGDGDETLVDRDRGGNDWIATLDGKDNVVGDVQFLFEAQRGGHDVVLVGDDDDIAYGDAIVIGNTAQGGNDRMMGGAGNDYLYGDARFLYHHARGGNDILIGGKDNDVLIGDADFLHPEAIGGNDTLIGVNPLSRRPGLGEFDRLRGNGGRDRFVLGDAKRVYYQGQGTIDHALILDFSLDERDVIQLHGNRKDYELRDFTQGAVSGVSIILKDNQDLVGAITGFSTDTLSLQSRAFQFVG